MKFDTCPITGHPCARQPECDKAEYTGNTGCKEWVLKEQEAGKKELAEGKHRPR